MSPRLRLLGALAAALALVAGVAAPAARAGTYDVSVSTADDVSGWQFFHDSGFYGCSIKSHPGPCADSDVASPTPLRIFAYGTAAHLANAYWEWLAPPTTTIESGSVRVVAATAATDTYAYMKARLRSEAFAGLPQLHVASNDGTFIWSIPSGNESVGLFLKTDVDRTYNDKWKNTIRVTDLTARLRDDTAPSVVAVGPAGLGQLAEPVPAGEPDRRRRAMPARASRPRRFATAVRCSTPTRSPHSRAPSPAAPPTPARWARARPRSATAATRSTSSSTDAAGETVSTPVQVQVDAHAPVAVAMSPAAATTDVRPAVSFSVDPGPSGLGTFEASLDGTPMQISGSDADVHAAADLAYGIHTVAFHATDGAGNSRDGSWTFAVIDTTPPSLSHAAPADGSSGEDRRPEVAFDLADTGTGVDPATLHVVLDGADVAAAGTYAAGHFSLVPASNLAYGMHHVKVTVSDRSGNAMPAVQWTFAVADVTPPILSDATPKHGSSGADRTPAVSFQVADAGIGVDPDTITVTLDGSPAGAGASFADGRFSYVPPAPLGFGVHTVSARVSDLAGNRSPALSWSFTVADEQPPVIEGRRPLPGSIVPGATVIAFDISDAGTGVDAATLRVDVDGSDVVSWGTLTGGHFSLRAGEPGRGRAHDRRHGGRQLRQRRRAGHVAVRGRRPGVARPGRGRRARLDRRRPGRDAAVHRHQQRRRDGRSAAPRLGTAGGKHGLRPGADRHRLERRAGRVLGLAGAHDRLPGRARGGSERADRAHAGRAPARDPRSVAARDAPRRRARAERPGAPRRGAGASRSSS